VDRLPKSVLYTFGVSDLFFGLMISMELFFFSAFLTDYAQFPLKIVGQIMLITSLFDVACAVGGGVILQRTALRFGGKYRSWLLIGPPFVAPLFVLQFVRIGSNSMAAWIIIFAFVSSHMLVNVVYTAVGSMVGRLSRRSDECTRLSVSRAQGACAAGLIFSLTSVPMLTFFGSHTSKIAGYPVTTAIYASLMIFGYWYVYRLTAGRDPYDESTASRSPKEPIKDMVRLVFRNRPLLFMICADTFNNAAMFIVPAFAFYYFTYVANDIAYLSFFMLATSIGSMAGSLASGWVAAKIGKQRSYWIALSFAALGAATAGFFGKTASSFTFIFCISSMLQYIGMSMSTALFSDTVIYGEWKTGKNLRAFTMALQTLTAKTGVFVRSAVVAIGLVAIGFVANQTPTSRVEHGITLIMALSAAAACAIAAAFFYFGYGIDEKLINQMQDDIALRNTMPVFQASCASARERI
jgi:Na+/melibiose symporter-like transporter